MAMSKEHKAAMAQGRRESRAINAYLTALANRRPGRPVSAESLRKQLDDVGSKLASASNPLKRVDLLQKRIDLEQALERVQESSDMAELEANFVASVGGYSDRKGVSYKAWREAGVPASVLKQGGVSRGA
jgi:hypothetical protein